MTAVTIAGTSRTVELPAEVFDVQVLPGITSPYLSGPAADQDVGEPLWTIPPG